MRQQLWAFPIEDQNRKTGKPIDERGRDPVNRARHINTHELLTSENFEDCLGSLYLLFTLNKPVFCVLSLRSDEFFPFYVLQEK